eukprot:CAMPEP_0116554714 /NCGR_PEP_ID=MMETSP0397-20121206/7744_1 /TAXON_ID=216820 /ORGANISM="Cyclophora tenuis, Strain ECT3854" /LENGTH=105 /DNA_ID=CAMNT_0004079903 /DNA_START=362 /DNA_END=679 /DNA_ORIENTATION=-
MGQNFRWFLHGHYQPDKRLFPRRKFRDRNGQRGCPLLALLLGDGLGNESRNPVKLRERGKIDMNCRYTRLFLLAAKFYYAPDEVPTYQHLILLRGGPDQERGIIP